MHTHTHTYIHSYNRHTYNTYYILTQRRLERSFVFVCLLTVLVYATKSKSYETN